ncbi:MAG: ABC transporter substrate-binding protein [Candidatus Binatia bacterium]
MKTHRKVVLGVAMACVLGFSSAASGQRLGKNIDEIVQLANKEKNVRVATSWEPQNEPLLLKGFYQKYPGIKVTNTRISGIETRERILNEALAGVVDHDLVNVSGELRNQYIKARILAGPVEWRKLFPKVKDVHFSPDGYFVASGFSKYVITYNPTLVPKDKVPKKWEDCLDPYWKGKLVVLTRPRTFTGLYAGWGEEKIVNYARALKNNQPIWKSSQSGALTQVAIGEYPMICGVAYHSTKDLMVRDPKASIAFSVPSDLPIQIGEAMAIMKGGKSPNSALLLAGWLVTPEGQKNMHLEGRDSPFVEGTESEELLKKHGAKPIWEGWDVLEHEAQMARKITAAWGFPKAKN